MKEQEQRLCAAPVKKSCCRQVAFVEDDEADEAEDETRDHQHPGIPGGDAVGDEGLDARRVVEWLDFEHPLQLVGDAAEGVHHVEKEEDAYRCASGGATGIHEGAEQHAEASGHEEEGELDQLRDDEPLPVNTGDADEER